MLAYNAEPRMKSKMYRCSYCTGGSGFTSNHCCLSKPAANARKLLFTYVADVSLNLNQSPKTCYLCTERPHICLSKCLNGCVKRPPKKCQCGKPIRFQSKKNNKNHGRFFWTCNACNFFCMGIVVQVLKI